MHCRRLSALLLSVLLLTAILSQGIPTSALALVTRTSITTSNNSSSPSSNNNWAGYGVPLSQKDKRPEVIGTIVVPKVTCTEKSAEVTFWVSLLGSKNKKVITEQLGVLAKCNRGKPKYFGIYKLLGHPQGTISRTLASRGYPVKAGDHLEASVFVYFRSDKQAFYTLHLENKTQVWVFSSQWNEEYNIKGRKAAA